LREIGPQRNFLELHCGNVPPELIESEWFGYRKGAFTGAVCNKKGRLADTRDTVVYFNQIDLLTLHLQRKLLRIIEQRKFFPLGDNRELPLHGRLVFSADHDLDEKIQQETFRKDLYYRISPLRIDVPPLRQRPADIISLFNYFLNKNHLRIHLSTEGWKWIREYPWPGNIREIENFIQKMAVLQKEIKDRDVITLYRSARSIVSGARETEPTLQELENKYIRYLITRYRNKSRVARILGISRKTLYNKLQKHGKN
jgi:DNA-binding NtrC family response regulator